MKKALGFVALSVWAAYLLAQAPVVPASNPSTGNQPNTTAWTSATAGNTSFTQATAGYSSVTVAFNQTTTITTGVASFEGSTTPDTSVTDLWYPISCLAPTTNGPTYSFQPSTNIAVQCNVVGYRRFRTRLSTPITGSGTVNLSTSFSSVGNSPIGNTPPAAIQAAPTGQGLISSTYLGTGSANSAKTTGAVSLSTAATSAMPIIVVIGCAGNFATSNWTAAVTDSAGNTYVQIGATSGTYPQANSTTQVCVPFVAKNSGAVTTVTFTISGSSSANTTTSVMAWGVSGVIPSLAAVDGWAPGTGSSATALSTQIKIPSHANELVIAGGCASTGTISLPAGSALTFDSGSVAIGSGTNCVTAFGGSAVMGDPSPVTGSFTDGSSAAYSEVAIVLKGYDLTDTGLQHLMGGMTAGTPLNKLSGATPAIFTTPPMWSVSSNPGTGVTATLTVAATAGKIHVVTGFCFGINGDGTGAAAQQVFTLSESGNTLFNANVNNPSGVGAIGRNQCVTGLSIPVLGTSNLTVGFGSNTAHALEEAAVMGYDIDTSAITY